MTQDIWLEFETASTALDPATVLVTQFTGREEISRCYEYVVQLEVELDGGLAQEVLEDLLRQPCRVYYGPPNERACLHGLVRSIRTLSTAAPIPVIYELVIVPRLWAAGETQRSRVFQNLDVPGMVKAVLQEMGFDEDEHYSFELNGSYPITEYTVQYQESDLAFIQRQCEHHGIFYTFVQDPDADRVVFGDTNDAFEAIENHDVIDYTVGDAPNLTGVMSLSRLLTGRPAGVVLREYNWRTPSIALEAQADADATTGRGFFYEYGQHFKDDAEGGALATARAQELLVTRDVFEGTCRIAGMAPGHHFELSGHPLAEFDQPYLVTAVEQKIASGRGSNDLLKRFTAIPLSTVYRPARTTPKPKIEGLMHARVDGEVPGTAAPIDEYGRYKILFPFDLVGQPGGGASRWVRLAQPSSGAGYGIHFPLHIGAEVAVSHLDGDPDRPIIINSPPNTETLTPVTSANPTQSEIVTQTGIRMTWDDDA